MSQYSTLKSNIAAVVKTNGTGAITGANLQSTLNLMVDALGKGYQWMGVANTSTNPGTPDEKVFYLATTSGTYTHFANITITSPSFIYYDTAWRTASILGGYSPSGINVIDNLNSTSPTDALSAKQGKVLNDTLQDLTLYVELGYVFMGIATPSTTYINDRTIGHKFVWIAATAGTYSGLGNKSLIDGEIAIITQYTNGSDQMIFTKTTLSIVNQTLVLYSSTAGAPSASVVPNNWNTAIWGSWSGAPVHIGDIYIDQVNSKVYMATSVSQGRYHWEPLNSTSQPAS